MSDVRILVTIKETGKVICDTTIDSKKYDGPGYLYKLSTSHENPLIIDLPADKGECFKIEIEGHNNSKSMQKMVFPGHVRGLADTLLDEFMSSLKKP